MALTRVTPTATLATAASSPPLPVSSSSSPLWENVVSDTFTRRCALTEIWGEGDSGKSTFALTAPGPIAYLHTYEKVDGLLERVAATGKVIRPCAFGGPMRGNTDAVMALAEVAVSRMERALTDAYTWARSIILDNHSTTYQYVQLARLGSMDRDSRDSKDNKKGQLVYGEINARWNAIIQQYRVNAATNNRTNLILIGRASDEYKGNQATGKRAPHGHKENAPNCDVRLRMKCEQVRQPGAPMSSAETVYSAVIEKPWHNGDMRGFEVPSMMLTFSAVMSLITNTAANEWE